MGTHSQTLSPISPLLVGRFGRSLQFSLIQFDEEAILDGFMANSHVLGCMCVCGGEGVDFK